MVLRMFCFAGNGTTETTVTCTCCSSTYVEANCSLTCAMPAPSQQIQVTTGYSSLWRYPKVFSSKLTLVFCKQLIISEFYKNVEKEITGVPFLIVPK